MRPILYPYPTVESDPALRVTRLLVDDVSKPRLIKSDDCKVVLYEESRLWQKAAVSVEVACEPEAVADFEAEHGTVEVTVTANCSPTNHRHAVRLARHGDSKGHVWSGTLELDRENLCERTYLTAALTATVHNIAQRPVATSPRWTVYVDEPQSLLFQGTLRVGWMDFRTPDAPPLARDFPKSTHIVDFDGITPRLLLNSGFDGLIPLLGDRKDRRGVDRALHDFKRTSIARATWLALITEALADVQGDPSDPTEELAWPSTEWKAEVLKYILPRVEPSKTDADLLALAAGDWRGEGAGQFLARAEAVVGELIGANEFVRRYVQTYDREAVR